MATWPPAKPRAPVKDDFHIADVNFVLLNHSILELHMSKFCTFEMSPL
jgi:hypothetical protein